MPSQALQLWTTARHRAMDQLVHAHRSVGGTKRGRRRTTQYINQAYCLMISSQFQAFCRDLHDECSMHIVRAAPVAFRDLVELNLKHARALDKGNPNPGNIGSDFNRFGFEFWDAVRLLDPRNKGRRDRLEEFMRWRNAIAHQDFDPRRVPGTQIRLGAAQSWRSACNLLARMFDAVMAQGLTTILGVPPW